MEIIWDNMKEAGNFFEAVNLKKISRDEQEWGGLGFIITGRDIRGDRESPAKQSYTIGGGDHIVVTPYWKELSWVFRNVYCHPGKLSYDAFIEGFWAACTGFFLDHPSYKPEQVIGFVFDFLSGMEEREQARNRNSMIFEEDWEAARMNRDKEQE